MSKITEVSIGMKATIQVRQFEPVTFEARYTASIDEGDDVETVSKKLESICKSDVTRMFTEVINKNKKGKEE